MAMDLLNHDEGWSIKTDDEALWAMKKISEAKADTATWSQHYKDSLSKIKAENDRTVEWMTSKLRQYFATLPHRKTKAGWQIYDLPNGSQMTMKPSSVDYVRNDDLICGWALQNRPQIIKVATSLDWTTLKKSLTIMDGDIVDKSTGEIVDIPGLSLTTTDESFTLKTGGNDE